MTDGEKKTGKSTKWLLIGGGVLVAVCCVPGACIGLLGSRADRTQASSPTPTAEQDSSAPQAANDMTAAVQQQTAKAEQMLADIKAANEGGRDGTEASSGATPATASPKGGAVAVGDQFTLGDYTYRVTRWRQADKLGSSFAETRPVAGATFVLVEYEITNNTNQTQTAMTGDFKLTDAKGREFHTSSKVETALAAMDTNNQDFLVSELQPGLMRTIRQGFEIPQDAATAGGLLLVVPEKGLLGTKKVTVRLE